MGRSHLARRLGGPGRKSMFPISNERRWQWKPMAIGALAACALIVAPAMGAFGPLIEFGQPGHGPGTIGPHAPAIAVDAQGRVYVADIEDDRIEVCLLYTSPSPRDVEESRMPSSA